MAKPNWENRTLFHGDNLDFMRAMDSETVDLIATDPPFNKNKDFHATPDSLSAGASFQDRWTWEEGIMAPWMQDITGSGWKNLAMVIATSRSVHSDALGAFLCFLGVRLIEMHRLLKPDGSIVLHCDHTAGHWIRAAMDAVFGRQNFRNEIIWHYGKMSNATKNFPSCHDTLLRYSKSSNYTFTPIKGADSEYRTRFAKWLEGEQVFYGRVKHLTDKLILLRVKKVEKCLGRELKDDDVLFDFDVEFKVQSDVIYNSIIKGNSNEKTGYPTQKPVGLYERIIRATSNEGDMVLDPFAGCVTTCLAAEQTGRRWVGIDLWKKVFEVLKERIEDRREFGELDVQRVQMTDKMPSRTDGGETEVPYLPPLESRIKPKDGMNKAQRKAYLAKHYGVQCQGCCRKFDHPDLLELDHNVPSSTGGWDHVDNFVLLCRPCNVKKSNKHTLIGLRDLNRKDGWMTNTPLMRDQIG